MNQPSFRCPPLLALILALLCAAPAGAVRPSQWVHETEADFQQAGLDQTVVTNLGRIELSRAADKLAAAEGEATIIYDALIGPDGRLTMALGPEGRLGARTDDDAIETIATFEEEQVFALARDGDRLWVAVSGENSRLEARDAEMNVTRTIELPAARYVWDVIVDGPRLWVATGTEGRLLMVDASAESPEPVVALDTEQKNLLCLGMDGKGRVYAGSDGEGLVYRVSREPEGEGEAAFTMFVLYDAAEPEIGALLVQPDGTVYAGTADAQQARPGRMKEAVAEEKGEPQAEGMKEPADGDEIPKEPAPEPKEDEPDQGAAGAQPDGGEAASAEAAADAAEDQAAEPAEPVEPSAQQYDKLRQVVQQRLKKMREGKQVEIGGGDGEQLSPRRPSGAAGAGAQQQKKGGNAVYRIQPDGFVQEVFRESVMVLKIVRFDGDLLIATGNEGQVFRVTPETRETTVIADLEPKQVPAMRIVDGQVLAGTANPAVLVRIAEQYADQGTFTHDPLDAGQPSLWGRLAVLAKLPEHTGVTVATRSGNLSDPADGGWSAWSEPARVNPEAEGQPVYIEVDSPAARFLQYRLELSSDGEATPSVSRMAIKYLVPNMEPDIASLKAGYPENGGNGEGPAAQVKLNVEWEVGDANNDALMYTLEARRLGGDEPFVEIADQIKGTNYEWDTRTMPEGRYELRLTASDAPDNVEAEAETARRISAPIVIDNSAPAIEDFEVARAEGAKVQVGAKVVDALSPIVDVRYKVSGADAEDQWRAVLPEDRIYDSTRESVAFTIDGLSAGRHVVTVRAVDALGNARYAAGSVVVPEP